MTESGCFFVVMKARSDIDEQFDMQIGWDDTVNEFILSRKSEGYNFNTIKNYQTTLKRFTDYCKGLGYDSPSEVRKNDVRKFLLILQADHSANYVNGMLSRVRSYYDFLCSEEYILENDDPTKRVKALKTQKTIIVVFNDNEVAQMIKEAGSQKNRYFAERDKLMIMILADCGLRVQELVQLEDNDIMKDKIFVNHGKGDKQRMMYVTPQVAKQVIKFKRVRDNYFDSKGIPNDGRFFKNYSGKPLKNDGVQKMLKKIALKCDIREKVRISPHSFRHWFAQSQLKNGVSIYTLSKLMGHESISTTQVYLAGLADEDLIESAIKTSPLLNMKVSKKEQ